MNTNITAGAARQGGNTSDNNVSDLAAKAPAAQAEVLGYAIFRGGTQVCTERSKRQAESWVDAEIVPLVAASPASAPEAMTSEQQAMVAQVDLENECWMDVDAAEIPIWNAKKFKTRILYTAAPAPAGVEDAKDAARYLWLRNQANNAFGKAPMVFNCSTDEPLGWDHSLWGQSLDDAIDTAMSTHQAKKSEGA